MAQLFSLGVMALPPEYVSYLAGDGRKEGGLTVEPGWFQLWSPEDVERWNRDYHVSEHGRQTKVSRSVFEYSWYHARSVWVTHPLAAFGWYLVYNEDKKRKSKPAA